MAKVNSSLIMVSSLALTIFCGIRTAQADSLILVTSGANQKATDSLGWAKAGGDQTLLNASGNVLTAKGATVQISLGASNSILSKVCPSSPCSWTGGGFAAGDTLLWTSDAGNGGNGPVRLTFASKLAGAGALLQANGPGPFTAKIEAFNGASSLGSFSVPSSSQGNPLYIGLLDQSGPNVTSVVFSLTTVSAGLVSDFAVDTVQLSAATAAPVAHLSRTSIAFGTQLLKTRSGVQTVVLSNSGNAPLNFSSIAASGDFAQTNNCKSPLAAGASCTISATFAPTAVGTRTGAIKITDNAAGSPQMVSLSGVGTEAKLSTTHLSFPATAVGKTSAPQTVTLTNVGSTAMSITSVSFGGINPFCFTLTKTCGSSLAAGASCSLTVALAPKRTGALTASLNIADNGGASPQVVSLSGTGQ